MKITSNIKGQIAMGKAELRALELGYIPSRPIFDARYDLIIDNMRDLKRVQVKYANGTSSNSKGSVVVGLTYLTRTKRLLTYQESEVDGLIIYIPRNDRLCFLPPNLFVGKKSLSIRLDKPKNNQKSGIIFAEDYYW
jgi:hypothetical protein